MGRLCFDVRRKVEARTGAAEAAGRMIDDASDENVFGTTATGERYHMGPYWVLVHASVIRVLRER